MIKMRALSLCLLLIIFIIPYNSAKAQEFSVWQETVERVRIFFTGKQKPKSPNYSEIPEGTLEVKKYSNNKEFCEAVNNPAKLSRSTNLTLIQLVEWRTYMLNNKISADTCLSSCPNPTDAMKDFCHSLKWCRSNCTTTKIMQGCSKNPADSRDNICVSNNCSPLPPPIAYYDSENTPAKKNSVLQISKEDLEIRKKVFLEISHKVIREFEDTKYTVLFSDDLPNDKIAYYSELGKTYQSRFDDVKKYLTSNPNPNQNYLQHMPETMLCINLPTRAGGENHFLEVMEQNNECGNAFGIGQVISMTFYTNLGLNLSKYGFNPAKLDKKCRHSSLQFLPTECGSDIFQSQFYRAEIFEKYAGYTIEQIFDRRAFDIELQIRLMYATIINSFAMTNNWWGAFTSYRGNGTSYYANFTPGKDPCMITHMARQYRPQGEL